MKVLEREIIVANARGVHSRVATGLALIAREHGVLLQIVLGAERVDCSSILDVLSMALVRGTKLTVRAEGGGAAAQRALTAAQRILTAQDEC